LLLVGGHPLRPQSCSETGWLGMFMCNSWWPVCYTFLPLCENLLYVRLFFGIFGLDVWHWCRMFAASPASTVV
jgi:hypothetical protein